MNSTAQIVDVTDIAQNLPIVRPPIVSRDHILDTVEGAFNQGFEVVLVEAAESLGKTTLLYLAAKRYRNQCCYLYIRGSSVYSYHPTAVRGDLCNQLHWVLNATALKEGSQADESALRQYVFDLTRQVARARKPFYFIVDGLDELPEGAPQLAEIIQMLPIGGTLWFRALLSGAGPRLRRALPERTKIKEYPLSSFAPAEVKEYFKDQILSDDLVRDFYIASRGNPGHLNTIRRLLLDGVSVETISDHQEVRELLELEWTHNVEKNRVSENVIRFVAFARHKITLPELAEITRMSPEVLEANVKECSFLDCNDATKEVAIVSPAVGRFLQIKLRKDEQKTLLELANYLLSSPRSARIRAIVPEYLVASNQQEALLNYLSHDYFLEGIRQAQSLLRLKRHADLGLGISGHSRSAELMRFSLLVNVISSLFSVTAAKAEVEALIAIGDYEHATIVANGATLPEDRLLLLSTISRAQLQKGTQPERVLRDQLAQLTDQIAVGSIDREKATTIAAELFPVMPDHAIRIVKASSGAGGKERSFDWAMASLSVQTLTNSPRAAVRSTADALRSNIEDQDAKSIVGTLSLFLAPQSAIEVLRQMDEIADVGDRLLILRLWCRAHPQSVDAIAVSEHALGLALAEASVSVNASFYKDIAAPLPYCDDKSSVERLVRAFDGQSAVYERLGPVAEVARLQLRLAEAEATFSVDNAVQRLLTAYITYETRLPDAASRAAFYAELAMVATKLNIKCSSQDLVDIVDSSGKEFQECIDELLRHSADHAGVFGEIIDVVAQQDLQRALALADRLNTPTRRNSSRLRAIKKAARTMADGQWIEDATRGASSIDQVRLRDDALGIIVDSLTSTKSKIEWSSAKPTALEASTRFGGAAKKSRALGRIVKADARAPNTSSGSIEAPNFAELTDALRMIDRPWLRIRTGFEAASDIASANPELSRKLLNITRDFQSSVPYQSEGASSTIAYLIDLCIRAFRGLVECKQNEAADLENLKSVIDRMPSAGDRARQWASLALVMFDAKLIDEGKSLVFQKLKPCVDEIDRRNVVRKSEIVCIVGTALWLANREIAEELIDECSSPFRDAAYDNITDYLISGVEPGDAYDWTDSQHQTIEFGTAVDVLTLLEKIQGDDLVYWKINAIAKRTKRARKRALFSEDQLQEIVRRIEQRLAPMFPKTNHIAHEGYRILIDALVSDLKGSWKNADLLISRAKALPNIADASFVMSHLADLMPQKERPRRRTMLVEAMELVARVPSRFDKINEYMAISCAADRVDKQLAKKAIVEAFKRSVEADDVDGNSTAWSQQQHVLEIAYEIDPELPNSLANLINNDPAKKNQRSHCQDVVTESELKGNLLNERTGEMRLDKSSEVQSLPESAWHCLGEINAGRAVPVRAPRVNQLIASAAKFDIERAYPILALVLENQRRMHTGTKHGLDVARMSFDTVIRATQFAEHALHVISKSPYSQSYSASMPSNQLVLGEGGSKKAEEFIRNWLTGRAEGLFLICDPYFTPDELGWLKLFQEITPHADLNILTGEEAQRESNINKPYEDAYRGAWKRSISSSQLPPDATIVIVGREADGKAPFHDRWILCESGGIRLGTSFNSLGKSVSELGTIERSESLALLEKLEPFVTQRKRRHLDTKLRYSAFSL